MSQWIVVLFISGVVRVSNIYTTNYARALEIGFDDDTGEVIAVFRVLGVAEFVKPEDQ